MCFIRCLRVNLFHFRDLLQPTDESSANDESDEDSDYSEASEDEDSDAGTCTFCGAINLGEYFARAT